MLMVFPDTVTFPCQVNVKVIESAIKVDEPVILPFASTCSVRWLTVTLVPDESVIEPLTTPFASIATVRAPFTG
jgi:hypothetical protein